MFTKKEIVDFYNSFSSEREQWKEKNRYYHEELKELAAFFVPSNNSVIDIGCGDGDLLSYLKPSEGLGVDISKGMLELSKQRHPDMHFEEGDAEALNIDKKFDYVIMSDLVGELCDVWKAFRELRKVTNSRSRILITYHNYLWEPFLKLAEKIKLKMPQKNQNWLSLKDMRDLLELNGYEVIKDGYRFLMPKHIPFISTFFNKFVAKLPLIRKLCLVTYIIAREKENEKVHEVKNYSVSVIIPTRNEAGNIDGCIDRVPEMGKSMEYIFVDGHSNDGTVEKIEAIIEKYKGSKNIKLLHQDGKGKGDAVRKGFSAAEGDMLFILDSDLTVPPEELPMFYLAIAEGRGDFVNGCRLIYQMEKEAMRFLNLLGNKFFGMVFSWILEQPIKDTLCGTKVLLKKDYKKIEDGRSYFGDFDPFGDFDLLFGAAKLNMKIVEMPVHYKDRVYGDIKIRRFYHGLLLLRMSALAFMKLKLFS